MRGVRMKLIIDIPEEIYKASQIVDVKYEDTIQIPLEVIANGTPIPDNATVCDIDAIKAEIGKQAWAIAISDTDRANGMWDAYRIIDKYREEQTDAT